MGVIKEYQEKANGPHEIITVQCLCRVLAWIRPGVGELLLSAACMQGLSTLSLGGLYLRRYFSLSIGQPQRLQPNMPLFF